MTIEQSLADLAKFATDIKPTRLPACPTHADARALIGDLEALARKVDAVVLAYGEVAAASFNTIPLELFTDQLSGALDGNALYVLDKAGRENDESSRSETPYRAMSKRDRASY